MNELAIFNNPEFGEIRTLETNEGKALFCGKDVASALGYKETAKAIREHCKGVSEMDTPTNGGIQKMKFIPESDVYRLAFSSKLPSAEKFTDWIVEEVIPTIRKTGGYKMKSVDNVKEMNARTRQEKLLLDSYKYMNLSPESYQLLVAASYERLTGDTFPLALPQTVKTYSAGEVGKMLGVSANRIGRLANLNHLKTDEYGITVLDAAPNGKQIPTFRYNEAGVEKLRELLVTV